MRRAGVGLLALGVLLAAGDAGSADKPKVGGIVVNKGKGEIIIPAKIAPRKVEDPRYKEIYPIEVIATYPFPKGAKAHETVVTFDVKPSEVHKAVEGLGLKPGKPARTEKDVPKGPEVKIFIELAGGKRVPVEKALVDRRTGKPMPKVKWLFTGSVTRPSPDKEDVKVYAADSTGTLIAVFPVTDETVFQSSLLLRDEKYVKLETNTKLLPAVGTAVKLVIVVPKGK